MKLKQICALSGDYGLNIPAEEYVDDGLPLLRTSDFDDSGRVRTDAFKFVDPKTAQHKLLQKGDILFSRAGTVGRCFLYDEPWPATFAAYLVRYRPEKSRADPRFIAYWAQSAHYWQQIRADTIESTIGNFSAAKLSNLSIVAPNLETQKAIADFLDRETARIDQLIEKKQRFASGVENEFLDRVSYLVIGGRDECAPRKNSGYSWHPTLPAHWRVVRLKFLCSRIVDCLHDTPEHSEDGEFPSVRTSDVIRGAVNVHTAKRVNGDEYRRRTQRLEPKEGDILFTREGERFGLAALVPPDTKLCLGQRMMMFRANRRVLPSYMMWSLNGKFAYHYLRRDVTGATSPHLNIFNICNVPIFLPPIDEQEKLVGEINSFFEKKSRLIDRTLATISLLKEFRSALITAAVTGQIDVATSDKQGQTDRRLDEIEEAMSA